MKKLIKLILSAFIFYNLIPIQVTGQSDLERRLTRNVIDCEDISQNSASVFAEYLSESKLDSAEIVVDFWEKNCGITEPIYRAKLLLQMANSSLTDDDLDTTVYKQVHNFVNRVQTSQNEDANSLFEYNKIYFSYVPLNSRFDEATRNFADTAYFDNDLERLFGLLYSERIDSFYHVLQTDAYAFYKIRRYYNIYTSYYKSLPEGHWEFTFGLFSPTNNALDYLGTHPYFGIAGGLKVNSLTMDVGMDLRFGDTRQNYAVLQTDTLITDYFFGFYIGLNFYYDLMRTKNSELLLSGGIGMDGFDTQWTSENGEDILSVFTANLNGGLTYRIYFTDRHFVGFNYKYNWVNYNHKKIVEGLGGNAHTICISIGGLGNKFKREKLDELHYMGER